MSVHDRKRDDTFGELRGLLAQPSWDAQQRERLWSVLSHAYTTSPQRYEHELLPYLLGARSRFESLEAPLQSFRTLDELDRAYRMLPLPCFGLLLGTKGLNRVGIRRFVYSESLSGVTCLDLSSNKMRDEVLKVITDIPHLNHLRHLNLAENKLGYHGIRHLANAPHLGALESLNLRKNNTLLRELTALGETQHLTSLRTLMLQRDMMGDAFLALVDSNLMRQLTSLHLSRSFLRDRHMEHLAGSPNASALRELHLAENGFGYAGVTALCASTHLKQLQTLCLSRVSLHAQGVAALTSATFASSLRAKWCDRLVDHTQSS